PRGTDRAPCSRQSRRGRRGDAARAATRRRASRDGARRRSRERRTTRRASPGPRDGRASERPARRGGGVGGLAAVTDLLAGHVVLQVEEVRASALGDRQQRGRRGDLLDLLLEEPQQELLAQG